ncbi:ester cyclase [Cryptosporangium phraense]|uniref:ester cyclase n=1 Tax=Cryptosporangium phraense TaxID=2593070 RepID=UPI0023F52B50|nr:ester cyclase [Cryptosporangium phraense]
MALTHRELVRRFLDAFHTNDSATLDALVADDYINHAGIGDGRGPLKRLIQANTDAFADLRYEIDPLIEQGDLIAVRLTVTGTHRGPYRGVAPTDRTVRFEVIDIWRVANGRLVEHWGLSDQLGLAQQLGLALAPTEGR